MHIDLACYFFALPWFYIKQENEKKKMKMEKLQKEKERGGEEGDSLKRRRKMTSYDTTHEEPHDLSHGRLAQEEDMA
jgi:hypothetical protein